MSLPPAAGAGEPAPTLRQERGEGRAHMGATFPDVGQEAPLSVGRGCVVVVTLGGSESSVNTPQAFCPVQAEAGGVRAGHTCTLESS